MVDLVRLVPELPEELRELLVHLTAGHVFAGVVGNRDAHVVLSKFIPREDAGSAEPLAKSAPRALGRDPGDDSARLFLSPSFRPR
jgi:hypothetical protein